MDGIVPHSDMLRDAVRTAVVWRTGALGDFVLTLPVLDALRERADHLRVIAPTRYRALWDGADAWIDAEGPEATALYAGAALDAEIGIGWTGGAASALRACGAHTVLEGRPHPPAGVHQADNLWQPLLPWLGPRRTDPRIGVPPQTAAGPAPVVFAPGSGGAIKRWPTARWAAIAAAVPEPLWVAGPLEADEPHGGPGSRVRPSLTELIRLAARCRAWLGPDSGPQHVAAAVGARVAVGFTPATDPRQWAPIGARVFQPEDPDQALVDWVISG